jgi:DNA ligase (NAD+)
VQLHQLQAGSATGRTVVRRASLHNADQIEKLDVRVGDTVFFVEKEIIPKSVLLAKRNFDSQPTTYISNCPTDARLYWSAK